MSISRLAYLGLELADPDAFDRFVTQVLGLAPGDPGPAGPRYRIDDRAWRIAVSAGARDDLAYAGFEVDGPEALDALSRRLTQAGVPVTVGDPALLADRGVLGLIAAEDPDGLRVEIVYGLTRRTEAPFASPAGVSGFVTGDQGLGHIVLATPDIAASRAFWRDSLGFRLSDIIRLQIAPEQALELEFYHCNRRHHTLALAPAPSPRRLNHFMLQARNLDDVGFALDRALAMGTPLVHGLGRHTNDQMVSFYARAPAGFAVEFGFGAVEVDDTTWMVSRHDRASSWGHHPAA